MHCKSRGSFLLFISTFIVWQGLGSGLLAGEPTPVVPIPDEKIQNETWLLPVVTKDGLVPAKTPAQVASVLQTVALLTFLTLAPSLLILTTCFTRIIVVLSFLRRALATQNLPPDQVLIGIGLFLTIFIMAPTWEISWNDGIKPYLDGKIMPDTGRRMTQAEMIDRSLAPNRAFMFACLKANRGEEEVRFFTGLYGKPIDDIALFKPEHMSTHVLIPAFITSELKRAFWMGFLLYLPFLVVDVVIASILMSMGMMMLPPVMISLPFKIILFVLVDGWRLLMEGLLSSFPVSVVHQLQGVT